MHEIGHYRVKDVSRGTFSRFLMDEPVPPPDVSDPYGSMGRAFYDERGLVRVEWNPVWGPLVPFVTLQTEHDESVPVEDRVPLVNWSRDDA